MGVVLQGGATPRPPYLCTSPTSAGFYPDPPPSRAERPRPLIGYGSGAYSPRSGNAVPPVSFSQAPLAPPAPLPLGRESSWVWSSLLAALHCTTSPQPQRHNTPDPYLSPGEAAGEASWGQAPAQGHPVLPPSSPLAGLAAALAAVVAQISPAAGAAAIFVGPARPPATGFTVSQSACAPTLGSLPPTSLALA